MKVQDLFFLIVLGFIVWRHNPVYAVITGLSCLIISIPLFSLWIFFTAERLVWYAATFILLSIILHLYYANRN